MKWSTDISEFENKLPNTKAQVEKAFELYDRRIPRRGKIVFLAGETGSGRGEALRAIAETFPERYEKVQIISGKFSNGEYDAISAEGGKFAGKADVIGNILSLLAKLVASISNLPVKLIWDGAEFLFDFIGQLLQTSASVKSALDEINENPPNIAELPFAVKKLLRAAAKDSPVVCLFENFDEARIEWHWFVESIAEEIDKDLPVLFFVSLRGKAGIGRDRENETKLEQVTHELVSRELAEWWYLPPLTRDEIAEWIGKDTEPGIVGKLHGVTGGIPRWVKEIWRNWKTGEVVRFSENHRRWEWSENKQTTVNIYDDVFNNLVAMLLKTDDKTKLSEARQILATAALEGTTFTGEVLDLAIDGKDEDYVIDLIDDHFVRDETNPHGILRAEGFTTFEPEQGTPRNVYRYRFISDWHWQVLDRYALTAPEKAEKSAQMIDALHIVYEGRQNLVAKPLSRLYLNIGNIDRAEHFEVMASYSSHREIMYKQAKWLMTLKTDDWDKSQYQQNAKFLFEAGKATQFAYPYDETIEIFEHSLKSARRAQSSTIEALAQYHCGYNYCSEGEHKIAKERGKIAQNLFKALKSKSGIAMSLNLLARIAYLESDYKDARAKVLNSLKIYEEIGDRQNIATSLNSLAQIAYAEGNYEESKTFALDALEINYKRGDKEGIAITLILLAYIASSEGDYEESEAKALDALKISTEIGNKKGIGAVLKSLSRIAHSKGDYKASKAKALDALEIDNKLGDREGIGAALVLLAQIAYAEGDYKASKAFALDALEINYKRGDKGGILTGLSSLVNLLYKEGEHIQAIKLSSLIVYILSTIEDRVSSTASEDFKILIDEAGCSKEQVDEFIKKAQIEYEKDGARSYIEELLKEL